MIDQPSCFRRMSAGVVFQDPRLPQFILPAKSAGGRCRSLSDLFPHLLSNRMTTHAIPSAQVLVEVSKVASVLTVLWVF